MARFKLTDKHYLNVPGTEWEHKETTQGGKSHRVMHQVGLYLNPDDPNDHNYPMEGMIIVSTEASKQYPRDIVFVGTPTRDMEPLDDEAEALLANLKRKADPFADLPQTVGESFSESMLRLLETKVASAPTADSRVEKLEAQVAALTKLLEDAAAAKAPDRRI